MNKIFSSLIVLLLFCPFTTKAQTATEAFLFSQSDPTGTARNLGTGNSMFSIGPEFSVLSSNPSGLGGYGKSEFLFSAGLGLHQSSSAFPSDTFNETSNNYSNFNLPNIGFIIHSNPNEGGWISSNWAVGLNRVAEYNREVDFSGRTVGSITDSWRENAEGLLPEELNGFEEGLAYSTGAIYDFEDDGIYESDYGFTNQFPLFKKESSVRSGGKTELFLAYGADLDHKLLIGVAVALPIINYTETRRYVEQDEAGDGVPFFNDLAYTSSLNTTGYGWNAKIGVTVKPTSFLNFAFAFQSPTRLNLSDNFNTTLTYDFTANNHDGPITDESEFGSFQYALRTPWSATGGIGIIAGRSGFVAVNAKFTDYGSMKYKYDVRGNGDFYEQFELAVNSDIKEKFGSALQLNMGGELVLQTNYRVRGGVSLHQSAYNNDNTFDPAFHAGAGYRGENFYVDLGYKLAKEEEGYLPYETTDAPQPLAIVDKTQHQLTATVGFKF